jgi:cell division protease FtsH
LNFGKRDDAVFLGRDIAQPRDYSEHTAIQIDGEVRKIVEENHQRASKILLDHRELLDSVALALLERETLDLREMDEIIAKVRPDLLTTISGNHGETSNPLENSPHDGEESPEILLEAGAEPHEASTAIPMKPEEDQS